MGKRKDRGLVRYDDDEWKDAHARKDSSGHKDKPFARWLRELSLGQIDGPPASEGYLAMLQSTRRRAVDEAMAWRKINDLIGLPPSSSPDTAIEAVRALLSR